MTYGIIETARVDIVDAVRKEKVARDKLSRETVPLFQSPRNKIH